MTCIHFSLHIRFIWRLALFLIVGLGLMLPAQSQTLDDKALYDWAEKTFPQHFPGHQADQKTGSFTYRYYPASQNALGVSDGVVYAIGPSSGGALLKIDTLAAFQCLVFAERCVAPVADLAVTPLKYGNNATFTLTGSGLDQPGIAIHTTSKCPSPKLVTSVDARAKNINCTVSATGTFTVTVSDASGAVVLSRDFSVPEPQVLIQTSLGNVLMQLNPTAAPITVRNFLSYANAGFYSNTLFHRVIPNFVAQGGGYTIGPAFKTPTFAPIKLESNNGLANLRGTIAMARTSVADSATSQFYFNLVDNAFLNYASAVSPGYAVFGAVVQGLEVVDQMAAVPTGTAAGLANLPMTDIVILGIQQVQ